MIKIKFIFGELFIKQVGLKSPGEKAKLKVNLHPLTSRHRHSCQVKYFMR